MKRQLEFVGSNVEKAAKAACKKLNIPREKLQYKVISYGATGIFGLVRTKKAKIEVVLPPDREKASETPAEPRATAKAKRKSDREAASQPTGTKTPDAAPSERGKSQAPAGDPKTIGLELLERITQLISEDAKVSVDESAEELLFQVESKDAGVLIGKRGQTLEAIQFLTEKVINKHSEGRVQIQVDVEGYQEKRKANLESLASRMADKADQTGKPATIGQMSSYERKIIHLRLKDDPRVRTQSKGEGFLRKLVIFPVGESNKSKSE